MPPIPKYEKAENGNVHWARLYVLGVTSWGLFLYSGAQLFGE